MGRELALHGSPSPPLAHGSATAHFVDEITARLQKGDILTDRGNSHLKDAARRHEELKGRGIRFLDIGTSGGIEGARQGACFLVGGDAEPFALVRPLLESLAVPEGVLHAGAPGAGHFVKLIHNAISFGMVQAVAEGVDLLTRSNYHVDLAALFHNWSRGSVFRGWLVELMERGGRQQRFDDLSGWVEDTRKVRWAVEYALEKEAWIPVSAQSELALYRYRNPDSVSGKAVALLRHGFGRHPLHKRAESCRREG